MKSPRRKTRHSDALPKPETRTFQTVDTSLWKRLEDMTSGCRCMQFLFEQLIKACQQAGSPTSAIDESADTGKACQIPLARTAQQETSDDWYRRAVEAGVEVPVAALGKSLICKSTFQGWTAAQLRRCFLMQFTYHKNSHTKGQSVAQLHNCCSRRMNCRYPKNSNPRLNSRTVAVATWRLDVYSCCSWPIQFG